MRRLKILDNLSWVTYYDSPINRKDKELIESFISKFCSAKGKNVLYRGTNKIFESHNIKTDGPILTLSHRLFMIGDKSEYYTNEKNESLNSTDRIIFEEIYRRLKDKLCAVNFTNSRTVDRVKQLIKESPNFCTFFQNPNNEECFIDKINEQTEEIKRGIRDYYLALFHTIGRSMVGNSSTVVSSSINPCVAKEFQKEGIIIITWTLKKKSTPSHIDINDLGIHKTIEKLGLPAVLSSPYPEQEEFCIKCGILPHFILGYIWKDSKFVVNKYLLEQIREGYQMQDIIRNGIQIDQHSFEEVLSQTSFKKYFSFIDGQYFDFLR